MDREKMNHWIKQSIIVAYALYLLSGHTPKVYQRAFSEKNLSNFTHDSMYGALCTISVQNFNF